MSFKTTVVLVVVLLAIGAVWLFTRAPRGSAAPELVPAPMPATQYVFDPRPEQGEVVRVTVERPDKPKLVLERVESDEPTAGSPDWRMVEPLPVAAEGFRVTGLVSTLTGLQSRARFESGAAGEPSAAEAGLEPPMATITLEDKEGQRHQLEVGKKVVMSDDTYVRVAGQATIHVAKRDLSSQVKRDANEYRTKDLVDLKLDDATHVRVEHAGQTYDLARGGDGEWVIHEPLQAYADRQQVRDLITKLNGLKVGEFVDDEPVSTARYGLDEPHLTFAVTTETKRELPAQDTGDEAETQPAEPQYETVTAEHRVVVGWFADLNSENHFAQTGAGPWVVTIPASDVKDLAPNLDELRDPRITRVKAAAITRLQLAAGGETVTLNKIGGRWVGTGDLAELERAAVTDVLEAFEDIQAISYIDEPGAPARYGLDQPRAMLTVNATGSLEPVTLKIGSDTASGRNAYVQRNNERTVMVTSAAQTRRLAIDPLALRSRSVFKFPVNQLRHVELQRGPSRYVMESDAEGSWTLTEPADVPTDPANTRVLASDLVRLRARQVVAKDDFAQFGLDRPMLTIHFRREMPVTKADAETQPTTAPTVQVVEHTLRATWKDGKAYARKDEDPYVFELDESVYRVLTTELIKPLLFTFTADQVAGVTITGTGGTLELAQEDDEWKYPPDPFVELDQEKVRKLIDDLARMRVETYLAYRDGDLAAAGLADAPASVKIHLTDGSEVVMRMMQERPGELPRRAALVAERRIFRLKPEDCEKLLRGLDEYVKGEDEASE